MSLFTTADLATPPPPASGAHVRRQRVPAGLRRIIGPRQELAQLVGAMQPGELIEYATGGKWSAHDLLEHVLAHTGPARVRIATWTLTEDPARALKQALDDGRITELALLFDHRLPSRSPAAYQYAQGLGARIGLSKCHAKVTTVENDTWGVAILSSQNYTRNPRLEAGCIITSAGSAAFHRGWIDDELAGTTMPQK